MASAAKGFAISKYTNYITNLQCKVSGKNPDSMLMPFLSNHDMDRIAGTFVTENNMRMAANLYLLSPGSPVIYYGEEIGMRGSRGSESTDANRRLAMLWGDEDLIRDPVGSTYPEKNQISTTVADQLQDETSLLRYYCKLLTLRHKYPAIARGTYTSLSTGEKNLGGFVIEYEGSTLLLLHNNGSEPISYDLNQYGISTLCDYIGMGDASLEGTVLTLGPQTSAIIQ
jgi:glycosidase